MSTTVAIKIDVDTYIGTRQGIPRLLDIFARHGVKATFFAVLGPDNSGKAIRRVFTRKGFVGKMARTNPLKIYGLKTLLYGTLLPAPMTGLAHPEILEKIVAQGHELGLHAYDHVLWQDFVSGWDEPRVAEELGRAVEAFRKVVGASPKAVAAPGWQATGDSLAVQDRMRLDYASDSRGKEPFFPMVGERAFDTLQIPGTLPTVDELVGLDGVTDANVAERLEQLVVPERLNVYTGHAEIEGMYLSSAFESLVGRLAARGCTFATLASVAARAKADTRTPICLLEQGFVAGRAGAVACQGAVQGGGAA